MLEHVLDLNMRCSKIISVLKKGGLLIVRVPFKEDLSSYSDLTYPYKYAHFDEKSLERLFERTFGCNIIESVLAGYAPRPSRLRYQFRLPKRDTVLIRFFGAMKKYNVPLRRFLLRRLFLPVDINIVARGKE